MRFGIHGEMFPADHCNSYMTLSGLSSSLSNSTLGVWEPVLHMAARVIFKQSFTTSALLTCVGGVVLCLVGRAAIPWPLPAGCQEHRRPSCDDQTRLQILSSVPQERGARLPLPTPIPLRISVIKYKSDHVTPCEILQWLPTALRMRSCYSTWPPRPPWACLVSGVPLCSCPPFITL